MFRQPKDPRRRAAWFGRLPAFARLITLVVVATLGVAVAVALASPPSTGWSTAYAFLTGNVAQTGGGTTYNDVSDVPDVALSNGTGDMAAVWLETATDAGQSTTSVDVSVNNGTGWSTDEPLAVDGSLADPFSNSEGEIDQPQVAEDSSGDAMAVWIDGGSVWYSYAAAGAGFSASGTDLYPASGGYATDLHLAFDGSGNAVLVWSAYNGSTWSVYSDITTSPGVFPAGGPTLIASGLPSNPQATVAVSQQNSAVIAYVDHGVGVYYSYVVTDADVFPTPSLGYSTATPVNDPVAAISYDGTGEVAWLQGTPGSVEVNTALVDASFSTGPFGYTNAATGTGDYSDLAIAMNPNLVTTNPVGPVEDDDTTALAFYDATQSQVDALVLPGVDVTDENTWAGNDDPISEPANIAQQPQLSMSGTVADEDTVTMLWQTGTGSTANQIDAITSTSAGAFVGQPVQTIQDGSSTTGPGGQSGTSEVAAGCTSATCDSLAADTNGDLVATWLQTDNDSNVQVAADCYQTGETGPVTATTTTLTSTGSFNAASCFSSYPDDDTTTDPTTTSTSTTSATPTTTTPTSTTPTTTTSTSTTPATPAPVLDQSSDVSKTSGTVKVELPGTTKFVTVSSSRQIPLGAVINATNGTVTITSALPNHKTGTATYRAGEFTLSQSRSGAISAKLVGSSFAGCPKPSGGKSAHEQGHSLAHTARKSTKKKKPGAPVRSLWTNAKGNYTTTGKNGSAAVLGTEWLTRDQCDGTYFSVLKTSDDPHGEIKVTVFYPHRHTVLLKRGHSLLAPASGY